MQKKKREGKDSATTWTGERKQEAAIKLYRRGHGRGKAPWPWPSRGHGSGRGKAMLWQWPICGRGSGRDRGRGVDTAVPLP